MAMGWQAWTVLSLLVLLMVLLFLEKGAPDQLMLCAMVVVWTLGIITQEQALSGFANVGVVTIGALFIVCKAVDKSKVLDRVALRVLGSRTSVRAGMLRLCLVSYLLSAIFNNTPLVVLLMPIVRDWCRKRDFAPSMFLIPLSYSTIMGGLLTTIGTSTNLLVNGLLVQQGLRPFRFFEPGMVSLPVGLAGILFLVALGPKILPTDKGGLFRQVREHGDHLITELQVTTESRFVGMTVADVLDKLGVHHASLLKLRRKGTQLPMSPKAQALGHTLLPSGEADPSPEKAAIPEEPANAERGSGLESLQVSLEVMTEIQPVPPHEQVKAGDILLLSLLRDTVVSVTSNQERGVSISSMNAMKVLGESSEFVELVLGQASPLIGEPLVMGPPLVEQHYHCGMIALRRRNEDGDIEMPQSSTPTQTFVAGDVLLVLAPIGTAFPKRDFLVVTFVGLLPLPPRWWDLVPPILFVVGLILAAVDIVDIVQVSMVLAVLFVLGGWVRAAEIREIVDWHLLILIGSALGLAKGMQQSGLADALAHFVLAAPLPGAVAPTILYIAVVMVTELVTNNAAAALGVPLAISLAKEMGLKSEKPLVGMVMFAASTCYACPIGYATNLMVKGPGGYNFRDFFKIGAPMDLLWIAGVSLVLPLIWPYEFS